MDKLINACRSFARLFLAAAEAGFALVALVLMIYVLLGADSGSFVIGVVANLGLLISAITPEAIIGVALVIAAAGYFISRK